MAYGSTIQNKAGNWHLGKLLRIAVITTLLYLAAQGLQDRQNLQPAIPSQNLTQPYNKTHESLPIRLG